MAEKKSIYQALIAAQAAIKNVGKNGKNKYDGYAYRGIDDVMDAVHAAFVEAGVVAVPEVLNKEQIERTSKKGELMLHTMLTVKYTFYAEDGTSISAVVQGEGMDRGDKSINKAMSGAYKYAMFQVLAIPTAEMIDSETESPEIEPTRQQPARQPAPKQAPAKQSAPQQEQIGPEFPISRDAAKKLSLMIAEISKEDSAWWPALKDMYKINKTLEIRQGDYNDIVHMAQERINNLKAGGNK